MFKNKKLLFLWCIIAGQLIWLGSNYCLRRHEINNAPVLHLQCSDHDPRDFLRGDYILLDLDQEIPINAAGTSLYWGEELCQSLNTYTMLEGGKIIEYTAKNPLIPRPAQAPNAVKITAAFSKQRLAVFWEKGENGFHHIVRVEAPGSQADTTQNGEIRCLMWGYVKRTITTDSGEHPRTLGEPCIYLSFHYKNRNAMRFYVHEKTGNLRHIWINELGNFKDFPADSLTYTVDIALRNAATPLPKEFYINGIPSAQAIQQIRNNSFPWITSPSNAQ